MTRHAVPEMTTPVPGCRIVIFAQLRIQVIHRNFIAPSSGMVSFAKALNRSITGSLNDHIHTAKFMLAHDMAPSEIGYRLNETPM